MESTAEISGDGLYRWTLTRRWGYGGRACWIMLNPSTADAEKDDPTIRSIIKRSQAWSCGGLVVVNLYPYRTSSPKECRMWATEGEPISGGVEKRNRIAVLRAALESRIVIAAWGAAPWIQTSIVDGIPLLHCIGVTQSGAPKHPLARGKHRVPENTPPEIWEAPDGSD